MFKILKKLRHLKKENKLFKKQLELDAYVINRLADKNAKQAAIIKALLEES